MLWTPGSSQSASPDHVWLPVARHLASYVNKAIRRKPLLTFVYVGVGILDVETITILKVWHLDKSISDKAPDILLSVVFGSEEINVFHRDRGHVHFELSDPRSVEKTLAWMQKVGVARRNEKWTDPI